jgi:hypothetical protein
MCVVEQSVDVGIKDTRQYKAANQESQRFAAVFSESRPNPPYSAFGNSCHASFFRRLIILIKKIQKTSEKSKSVLLGRSLALHL